MGVIYGTGCQRPIDSKEEHDEQPKWSPLSTPIYLTTTLPSSLPPHATMTHNNNSRSNLSTTAGHHALPHKPPPPQSTIGMKPDQDPNSKHGIFQLTSAADVKKKKGPLFMPNRTSTSEVAGGPLIIGLEAWSEISIFCPDRCCDFCPDVT